MNTEKPVPDDALADLHRDTLAVRAAVERSQYGENRLEIPERAEQEHGQPVQQDHLARMELEGKVAVAADHRQSAEVPAVEGGEGMMAEQGMADFRCVEAGKRQQDIGDAGERGDQQEKDAGGEKGLLLQLDAFVPVEIEDEGHGHEQQAGDGDLGGKETGQDKPEEDNHPQVDDPERRLLE